MKGFTFIEILIVIAIFGLITAGLFSVLIVADLSWHEDMSRVDLEQEARRAMDGMVRELRQSKTSNITISNGNQTIEFAIPVNITSSPVTYSENITYSLNTTNHMIVRTIGGTDSVTIGSYINYLNFNNTTSNIIEISLNTKKTMRGKEIFFPPEIGGVEQYLTEKVRLRNDL